MRRIRKWAALIALAIAALVVASAIVMTAILVAIFPPEAAEWMR